MKLFKCVVVLLCLTSIGMTCHVLKTIKNMEHKVQLNLPEDLEDLPAHERIRGTTLLQINLMTHHKLGIHESGAETLCPLCQESYKLTGLELTDK